MSQAKWNRALQSFADVAAEAVASLLDPFQPDSDEASRLNNSAPARTRSPAD